MTATRWESLFLYRRSRTGRKTVQTGEKNLGSDRRQNQSHEAQEDALAPATDFQAHPIRRRKDNQRRHGHHENRDEQQIGVPAIAAIVRMMATAIDARIPARRRSLGSMRSV